MAFKVGDKIEHRTFGKGEVAFGPFDHYSGPDFYLMRDEDGKHALATGDGMALAAKFKVGDRVKSFAATYTVEAGPFFAPAEWYAVKSDRTGGVMQGRAEELSLVAPEPAKDEAVKVGDVVRILKDGAFLADVKAGDLFEVEEVYTDSWGDEEQRIKVDAGPGALLDRWTFRPQDFEKVAADKVAVVDGKIYDLTARYRDNDGDVWRFERLPDGDVRGNWHGDNIDRFDSLLSDAVTDCGPLTRV